LVSYKASLSGGEGFLLEKHTKIQTTQHDCRPSLLGDGSKGIEIVYGEEKDKPNEPSKEGTLSFVLFESPFTSVSTVIRGHPGTPL
jgi:hypothetical protein